MNFEVHYALKLIGMKVPQYLKTEAFADPLITIDITSKRYAIEILKDLKPSSATRALIEKIRLY